MKWLALVLALAACSESQSLPPDGGAGRIECDPSQQACPAGQTCDLVCDAVGSKVACRHAGDVPLGMACMTTETCAAATGCFATGSTPQSCIRYCQSDPDCPQGTACRERQVLRNCPGQRSLYMLKFCLP
jgi:hypothetical protein